MKYFKWQGYDNQTLLITILCIASSEPEDHPLLLHQTCPCLSQAA